MQKYIMSGFFFAACALAIILMFTLPGKSEVAKEAKPSMPEVVLDATAAEASVKANCISCHGDQLQGGVGPGLQNAGSHLTPEQIYNLVSKGKGIMPAFKDTLAEEEVANVAQWLAQKK
ncbi:c-type cytochrome [Paenibacillus crassostreae]|uniref:Cytochrome C n=1 Tax=Paenibacillus crassostreae TaxID=1763538 RepID=A0A162RQ48_9BACL|nr:cytochrome c [Paenibacillus crassostreae]AOZ92770.1 cytochrome C [Paenibacillus crassostreae]OAB73917.1 cytochrome C [Paenibacillus crassostreae]